MATTGQEVFNLTMALIDEVTDSGAISDANTRGYKAKTPAILTILQVELSRKEGIDTPNIITDISLPLDVSDYAARLVLPYGLATHLMLDENPDTAAFFNQKYEEMKRKIPTSFVPITDVYGVRCAEDEEEA